jgi:hypothetical protein
VTPAGTIQVYKPGVENAVASTLIPVVAVWPFSDAEMLADPTAIALTNPAVELLNAAVAGVSDNQVTLLVMLPVDVSL